MYLIRTITEYSYTEIGDVFGGRDHSTVLVSYDKIENESRTDNDLYATLQELNRMIREYSTKGI
jgi:chromosomal replication initiator protein